jgi:hypothetical protein
MDLFLSKKYFRGRTRVDDSSSSKHVMKQLMPNKLVKRSLYGDNIKSKTEKENSSENHYKVIQRSNVLPEKQLGTSAESWMG